MCLGGVVYFLFLHILKIPRQLFLGWVESRFINSSCVNVQWKRNKVFLNLVNKELCESDLGLHLGFLISFCCIAKNILSACP